MTRPTPSNDRTEPAVERLRNAFDRCRTGVDRPEPPAPPLGQTLLVTAVTVLVLLTSVTGPAAAVGVQTVDSAPAGPVTPPPAAGSPDAGGPDANAGSPSPGTVALNSSDDNATAKTSQDRETTVVWRGFRHVWSYNHRFNRFGSWVNTSFCGRDVCDYEVGHAAASGSGEDKAAVRDAYTEISAENVDVHAGTVAFDVTGTEKDPKNGGSDDRIVETTTVTLDPGRDIDDHDRYAVVLNGFDMKKTSGASAKVIDFEISTSEVTRQDGDLTFTVRAEVLLDCDSVECKGRVGDRGGKIVQDVDYDLEVQYLVIGGDRAAFAATRNGTIENSYRWPFCVSNSVENPLTEQSENDAWGGNRFPAKDEHMNCEASKSVEIHYDDRKRQRSIPSAGGGYSVGTVGIKSLSVSLDGEAHFTQYDTVVGGAYDHSEYSVHALSFFKEWSSRPGQYKDARFSYGHSGGAEVSVTPILLEFRDACKRSFVNAGGIHWKGDGRDPTSAKATVTEQYRFAFGDHWKGEAGGQLCQHDLDPPKRPSSRTAKPAFWVPAKGGTLWNEFGGGLADPTKLTGRPGDRYYSEEQTNAPVDTPELRRVTDFDTTDDDGDGNVSEHQFDLDADLRYDDPLDDSRFGDPHLTIEYRRAGGGWWTASYFSTFSQDRSFTTGPRFDGGTTPPEGTYTHVRITVTEGDRSGPRLDRIVKPLPRPVRFETVANDRVVRAFIDSTPSNATLYIDGKRVGRTPVEGDVPAGEEGRRLRIVLKKEGYQPYRIRLKLKEGHANDYTFDLDRPNKPIVIRSEPNASVWFDGARVGTTPFERGLPPSASVDVELRPLGSGYQNRTFLNVSPPATIDATLPREGDSDGPEIYYPDIDPNNTLRNFDPEDYRQLPNLTGTVASASVPDNTTVGRTAVFDAVGSYSFDGSIDSYRWQFGDGTSASGRVVNHTYTSRGTYRVTLTVTANGSTANTTETVTVRDRPPRAAFSVVDPPVESGETAAFDASASVDPEGNLSVIHWQMGDGVRRTGERITHIYTAPGNYTVTVRVVDGNGNADEINRTIHVREPNDPPRAALSLSTTRATVGETVTLDATGSTDPDGSVRRHVWKLPGGATAVGPTLTRAFSTPGRHDITLVVVDGDGERSTTTRTVTVFRATPTATPTPTTTPTKTLRDDPDRTDTVEATDTPEDRAEPTDTATPPATEEARTTDPDGDGPFPSPGFGPLVSVVALLSTLGALALLARRRR